MKNWSIIVQLVLVLVRVMIMARFVLFAVLLLTIPKVLRLGSSRWIAALLLMIVIRQVFV